MNIILSIILIGLILIQQTLSYLIIKDKSFYYNNQRVYLSGVNIAWVQYNNDWGNGKYFEHRHTMVNWLDQISKHGGNTVRVWLHVEGAQSPKWDGNGFVTGTDNHGTLINEMSAFLDDAASKNLFVIFVLWNAAVMHNHNVINLIWDDHKLQTYIDHCLYPMVKALHGKKSLAAWEIMNEPEGAVQPSLKDNDHCFDTSGFHNFGWSTHVPIKRMSRFINWQSSAIHSADPSALVTVGTWNHMVDSEKCSGCANHYSDECLSKAGGKHNGHIDFYQMHTYEWSASAPINHDANYYGLNKPLIIGEYSAKISKSKDPVTNAKHYYFSGYNGALSWQYNDHHDEAMDTREVQNRGMQSIMNENKNGIIKIHL